ncbi:hypothetical protein R1sor_004849 [Riccia sorocarpa]|uniref:Uncharacterized protein n=1 Tax=Riccia sorocarpa TaxID=122646 RepID=A0ABD3HIG1_9MARC
MGQRRSGEAAAGWWCDVGVAEADDDNGGGWAMQMGQRRSGEAAAGWWCDVGVAKAGDDNAGGWAMTCGCRDLMGSVLPFAACSRRASLLLRIPLQKPSRGWHITLPDLS